MSISLRGGVSVGMFYAPSPRDRPMSDLYALGPPPRRVPLNQLLCVWLNPVLFAGVLVGGFGSLGIVPAFRHGELPGEWHLFWERREAPGWLDAVDRHTHHDKKGVQVTHTYRYRFRLPDGQVVSGSSTSGATAVYNPPPKWRGKGERPPDVTVEYHPRRVEANRLKGTTAQGGGFFVFFGLLIPVLAAVLCGIGLYFVWWELRLLKHGLPAEGYVTGCRLAKRQGQASAGDASVSWSSQAAYQPLEEFQAMIHAQHQAALAQAQSRVGVGCAAVFAFCFFAMFFGILSAVVTAFVVIVGAPAVGLRTADWDLWLILLGGLLGGVTAGVVAVRKTLSNAAKPVDVSATPSLFKSVECVLWYARDEGDGEAYRTLQLHGDGRDAEARPLLYDPVKPSRILLAEELSGKPEVGEDGSWRCARRPWLRLVLATAALATPAVAWWGM
jgi:hypothetical protein